MVAVVLIIVPAGTVKNSFDYRKGHSGTDN
jgi:hypothetical protein